MSDSSYTTQLGAGLGMIEENIRFLQLWEPGDSVSELHQNALNSGSFPDVSARRLRNLVAEMFAPRFLVENAKPAIHLKQLLDCLPQRAVSQLVYLYTCRAQRILHDFITELYWPKYESGNPLFTRQEVLEFITSAMDSGKMKKRWSENLVKRVAGYLGGCCIDFGLAERIPPGSYSITPIYLISDVFLYIVHDLRFRKCSDHELIHHEDWKLWGMSPSDVFQQLQMSSRDGHFIVQGGVELTRITWKYNSMEEALDAVA